MRSCPELGLILLLALPAAAAAGVPPALEARVAAAIAGVWHVPAESVRLEWPRTTLPDSLPTDALLRLVGEGRDGWQVVRLGSGPTARALRVRAGRMDTVRVAARALAAGSRLAADDLRSELRPCWGAPAARSDELPAAGWRVCRALAAGETVDRPAVVPPVLVAAGDPVRLVWCRGDVNVSLAGTALNAARRGEVVRARVQGRAGALAGTVTGPGTAVLTSGGER